jgi:hypothetical protein
MLARLFSTKPRQRELSKDTQLPSANLHETSFAEELDGSGAEDELGSLELEDSSMGTFGSSVPLRVAGAESLPQAVSKRKRTARARGRLRVSMVCFSVKVY